MTRTISPAPRSGGRNNRRLLDVRAGDRFALKETFVQEFRRRRVDWGPVGYLTYKRTYSRRRDDGSTEEWWQTVQRVVEGTYTIQKWHCRRHNLPWSERKAQNSAQEMYRLIFEMKFLPPGRGLWSMGTELIEKLGGVPLFNCAYHTTDHPDFARPYTFVLEMSMLGVGTGFDTAGAGKTVIKRPRQGKDVHVVADSREGWSDLVRRVLNAYIGKGSLPGEIDYDEVRPSGTPIKTFGGVAAGPEPLQRCVAAIHSILQSLIGSKITSTAIVDLMDNIGVCVVSGNVRRSALIALGKPDDRDFMSLKDPQLYGSELMSHRWASNNTVFAEVGMDYALPAAHTAKNGEPGYFWLDNAQNYGRMIDGRRSGVDSRVRGLNPCAEICLESGEECNLVETFPARHANYQEYERTLKFAYLYAKTVTLIPLHDKEANRIQMRNRRIGLSQSGIAQSFTRHGRRTHFEWCDKGYGYVQRLDQVYSDWLAIPRSIKTTTVKPAGTTSLLPGATPGMHFEHSEYYYRTIRVAKTSPLVEPLRRANHRIEDDLYDSSSLVVYFPVKARYFDRAKAGVSMWEQLEIAAALQAHWSDNAVSATITFASAEADDIARALELYESRLKSISFLPLEDHGYVQAPYIAIDQAEYERASAELRPLRLSGDTHDVDDAYCDGDKCVMPGGDGAGEAETPLIISLS